MTDASPSAISSNLRDARSSPLDRVPQRETLPTQRMTLAIPSFLMRLLTCSKGITAERVIGASQDFGDHLQSLFERRSTQSVENRRYSLTTSTREALFPTHRPRIYTKSNMEERPPVPTESEAFQLLDAIMLYFYEPQHLFDAREVSDRISMFFESPQSQLQNPSIWTLHIILIFAVGRLLRGETDGGSLLPGFKLFTFVDQNLPSPTQLRKQGLAGIEVLALMVVYLQNIDQKDDASIYV